MPRAVRGEHHNILKFHLTVHIIFTIVPIRDITICNIIRS